MTAATGDAQLLPWGDQAFLVRLESRIDPALNARITALEAAIRQEAPGWLVDCVPSYAALLIQFNPLAVPPETVESFVRERLATADSGGAAPTEGQRHDVPVWYHPTVAPDLEAVAAHAALSVDDVIDLHSAATYRVYLLGFRPGFPFLGLCDPRLAVPRRASPRTDVAAGSVGIAGRQTGIYPTRGPGGWSIIGRTPWSIFDANAPSPFRLRAGDQVRFVPIDGATFQTLAEARGAG